ncbi:hypothetical protein [Streptomyces sp. MMG1533]|uniref:hypothetical protein n=1 Tax=Streptomyces sp. MMG1533 TaxID=1415546 RepID=UPI000ACD3F7C|nr:hypothetical protein [Streptomyces sp. MMG1533]
MNDNHPAGHGQTRALTVADVLALPVLAAGQPQVVAARPSPTRIPVALSAAVREDE